ncbi:cytochrome b-c1 complex subunit 7-2, mitochondrial isoform X1 [Quercus robur]|uniref:cytochrome b-c1 complex subunit 7-2, mitochondrial isoform X1 n=1 Tax=Quercus robur TaxID=38942 RepID=UPI0021634A0A|nr:cytochrome b-c1 complex subunit 7-2, mitochondrial isoform X1 [Quercus robur]
MASLMKAIVDPKKNWLAALHMKSVSNRLRKYGLRYDDLYDPYYDLDIKEALNRLPREIVDARNQRLKRAMDLSMKHQYLPQHLQAVQTPFRSYLQEMLALMLIKRRACTNTMILHLWLPFDTLGNQLVGTHTHALGKC